jgi:acetolactate synthase-1/2/3 large subunit
VLLAVGGDLDGKNTRNWSMPRPPVLVTVDPVAPEQPEGAPDAAVTGRVGEALRGLLERVPTRAPWAEPGLRDAVRARLAADPATAEALTVLEAVEAARTATPCWSATCRGRVLGGRLRRRSGPAPAGVPGRLGHPGLRAAGAIGPAAAGHPVIAVCGDGGLMMALGELATLVQQGLAGHPSWSSTTPATGCCATTRTVRRAPARRVDLCTPDFVALAATFGMAATAVEEDRGAGRRAGAALRTGRPPPGLHVGAAERRAPRRPAARSVRSRCDAGHFASVLYRDIS